MKFISPSTELIKRFRASQTQDELIFSQDVEITSFA